MVTATVSVDRAALTEITGMLDKFGKDFPGRVGVMTRKVGLSLCDSPKAFMEATSRPAALQSL